jgi:glycosyltransferase involved in cell wall biosynthesis
LIEAMAFGLPILTTRWRSIPELFPANYPGLVDIRSPEQIASLLPVLMTTEAGEGFRDIFLRTFTLERHLAGLADAFLQVERTPPATFPAAVVGTFSR